MSVSLSPTIVIPAYTRSARTLHWLTAALILAIIPMGIALDKVAPGPLQNILYDLHRSCGVVVIGLTLWRLISRIQNPPRPLGDEINKLQKLAASLVHFILYASDTGLARSFDLRSNT
jgi:cytochrome b561